MDTRTQMIINEAIIRLSEGRISAEEIKVLEGILDHNPEAIEYFIDCSSDLSLCEELLQRTIMASEPQQMPVEDEFNEEVQDAHLWDALLRQEQTAPSIQIPSEEPRQIFIQKVEYAKNTRKFDKRAFSSFVISAAAILLVVLFIRFLPPKSAHLEVATVVDSINAKWANAGDSRREGSRLFTGSPLLYWLPPSLPVA